MGRGAKVFLQSAKSAIAVQWLAYDACQIIFDRDANRVTRIARQPIREKEMVRH
jgi:hypothetical protein